MAGCGGLCVAPCSGWVWHLALSVPLHIVRSPRVVPVPLLSCVAVFVVGGEVRWCVVEGADMWGDGRLAVWCVVEEWGVAHSRPSFSPPSLSSLFSCLVSHALCLLSQHCWFSVVSLWQDCVIVE